MFGRSTSCSAARARGATLLVVGAFALFIQGCAASDSSSQGNGDDKIVLSGTMQLTNFELGCWQFVTDDGKKYEVTGINAEQLQQQGLRAEILVRQLKGIGSVCTSGELVELLEIIRISY